MQTVSSADFVHFPSDTSTTLFVAIQKTIANSQALLAQFSSGECQLSEKLNELQNQYIYGCFKKIIQLRHSLGLSCKSVHLAMRYLIVHFF